MNNYNYLALQRQEDRSQAGLKVAHWSQVRGGMEVGPDSWVLPFPHALFCNRDLAFIILAKGVTEDCLRGGGDLGCSAAGALLRSVTATVTAVSAWSPELGKSPLIRWMLCSLLPHHLPKLFFLLRVATSTSHCPPKSFPYFKVKLKFHVLQGACLDYHPHFLTREEVIISSAGLI